MDVDPAFKYSLSSNIEHIKRYYSKGYGTANRKMDRGYLVYVFYGDLYTRPGAREPTPAYICFVFDKHWWECKWKLIIIETYDSEKNSNDHSE